MRFDPDPIVPGTPVTGTVRRFGLPAGIVRHVELRGGELPDEFRVPEHTPEREAA
jgi:hypothetical protein